MSEEYEQLARSVKEFEDSYEAYVAKCGPKIREAILGTWSYQKPLLDGAAMRIPDEPPQDPDLPENLLEHLPQTPPTGNEIVVVPPGTTYDPAGEAGFFAHSGGS